MLIQNLLQTVGKGDYKGSEMSEQYNVRDVRNENHFKQMKEHGEQCQQKSVRIKLQTKNFS